jgi:hypothetical protein
MKKIIAMLFIVGCLSSCAVFPKVTYWDPKNVEETFMYNTLPEFNFIKTENFKFGFFHPSYNPFLNKWRFGIGLTVILG